MAKKNKRRGPQATETARVKTVVETAPEAAPSAAQLSRRGYRETADALVVAFVLAFLIRTFEAEMFVIPTGSMAPTLMGRHKDVFCEQCGVRYKVNSSDDRSDHLALLQREVRAGRMTPRDMQRRLAGMIAVGGECPQCRYLMPLSDELPTQYRSEWHGDPEQTDDYSGDRLLVSKYTYSFTDPKRWDIAVFKYPGNSQMNYIKRVVGLPGEQLRVFQGDLFVRPNGSEDEFGIARKPPKVVLAMKQFVHDTQHEAASLRAAGWPLAWAGDGWEVTETEATEYPAANVVRASYRAEATAGESRWLRYRHRPPSENVWARVLGEGGAIGEPPPPRLITDFTPYNTRLNLDQAVDNHQMTGLLSLAPRHEGDLGRVGLHWVSDLILEADLTVESDSGSLSLDLVEAGDHYGVTFDIATGDATLWRRAYGSDQRDTLAEAPTSLRGRGDHAVRLANVDSQLLLWVDGAVVEVDATYAADQAGAEGEAQVPRASDLDEGDLAPAGLGVDGASVVATRLRLWRDGYYIATNRAAPFATDLPPAAFEADDRRRDTAAVLGASGDPSLWYAWGNRRRVDFPIDEGQLFMMGDNSGWSLDARLWAGGNGKDGGQPGGPYLERKQLVGKAVCVYWPHSWYRLPLPRIRGKAPMWPNFEDMRLVR